MEFKKLFFATVVNRYFRTGESIFLGMILIREKYAKLKLILSPKDPEIKLLLVK